MDELKLPLIPAPRNVHAADGDCVVPREIPAGGLPADELDRLFNPLKPFADKILPGLTLLPARDGRRAHLQFLRDDSHPPEGYTLLINRDGIRLEASSSSGFFYSLVSLFLLLAYAHKTGQQGFRLNPVHIRDNPRFMWRGMHLDVVRHFFPVEVVKRYLDVLALHKINTFHWHLTDDQGWRIPIGARPRLTEVGAWRIESDGSKYGGFYSHDEIREVVRYAAERHISVIPEIEMPGHSRAALAAYPDLCCTGEVQPVPHTWGMFRDVLCAGNENTFEFIHEVLAEVAQLFPTDYIHIGGDESPRARWRVCERCNSRLRQQGLYGFDALQAWFIRRVDRTVHTLGKRLIGWDEILDGGGSPSATVMAWRSLERGKQAALAGHDVVMCPTSHCYFDYTQSGAGEPPAPPERLTLEQVMKFDPAPDIWLGETTSHILGGQGNLWTERIADESHLQYMLLPRLCALAERLWSPADRTLVKTFKRRLNGLLPVFDKLGYNYRRLETA